MAFLLRQGSLQKPQPDVLLLDMFFGPNQRNGIQVVAPPASPTPGGEKRFSHGPLTSPRPVADGEDCLAWWGFRCSETKFRTHVCRHSLPPHTSNK